MDRTSVAFFLAFPFFAEKLLHFSFAFPDSSLYSIMLVTLKIAVLRTGRRRRRYTRDTTNDRIVEFESSSFVFPVGTDPLEHCRSFFCDVASSSDGQGDAGGEWIRGRTCLARCISPRIGNDRTPTMCNLLTHSSTTLVVFALAKLMYPELTFATAFFIFFFPFFFL